MPQRATTRPRKRRLGLHDFLLTHKRNGYKPHLFRTASVSVLLLGVVVLQAAYFAQVNLVFPKTGFLASVLPGALIDLTNSDRASNNLSAVTEDSTLDQAAQDAANDMAAKGYFAHVSPDGATPWDWLRQVGYNYEYAGENLAVNFTDSDQVETAWMNSPTHRANILKSQYTKVGIGVANGTYEGKEATFVVQFFATPEGGAVPAQPSQPVQQATPTKSGAGEVAIAPKAKTVAVIAPAADKAVDVLGAQSAAQVGVSPQNTSVAKPAAATPVAAVAQPHGFSAFLSEVATSPTRTLLYVLAFLTAVVGAALLVEISVKMRMRYVELTGGGLALMVVLIAVIIFNVAHAPKVQIPSTAAQQSSQT